VIRCPRSISLVGASPDAFALNGTNPALQYVVQGNVPSIGHAITPVALSFSTLWSGLGRGAIAATNGLIGATNLSTHVRLPTISTGATCQLKDLQATSRWLYWSCGGIQRSGVIDPQTNARLSVPSGAAMLGDGYLVRHFADGSLVMNDFHSDSLGPAATLAHVPAGRVADDRGHRVLGRSDRRRCRLRRRGKFRARHRPGCAPLAGGDR
jgi:hypothetical protein